MRLFAITCSILLLGAHVAFPSGQEIANPRYGPAPYPLSNGAIASNGAGFLAVWRTYDYSGSNIDGVPIDGAGRPISQAALRIVSSVDARSIQLLPFEDHFVLVWTDSTPSVTLAEVSSTGRWLRMILSRPIALYSSIRVAWNGERFLLLQQTPPAEGTKGRAVATIVDRDGTVERDGIVLFNGTIGASSLISADPDFILVTSGSGISVQRIASDGTVSSNVLLAPASGYPVSSIAAAARGDSVAVAWPASDKWGTFAIESAIASASGQASALKSLKTAEGQTIGIKDLLATPEGYVLIVNTAPSGPGNVSGAALRYDLDMSAVDPAPVLLGSGFTMDSAVSGDLVYALGSPISSGPIEGVHFTSSSAIAPQSEVVSIMPTLHQGPAVGSDGLNFLVAWVDGDAELRAKIVSAGVVSGNELDLGRASPFGCAIAYGGGTYLVVWRNGQQVVGRRITPGGIQLEDRPFLISPSSALTFFPNAPAASFNGSQFLVVWPSGHMMGALVSPSGNVGVAMQVAVDPVPEPHWNDFVSDPQIAWNGQDFLLLWTRTSVQMCVDPICQQTSETRAIRVDGSGKPADSQSTVVDQSTRHAAVASNGSNFLLAIDDADGNHIRTAETAGALRIAPAVPILQSWTLPMSSVAWNGQRYIVAWRYATPPKWRLAVATVTASGAVEQKSAVVTGASNPIAAPGIATNTIGEDLIVDSEHHDDGVHATSARTTSWTTSDMEPLPPPPHAPDSVDALRTSPVDVLVTWTDASSDEEGFIIEQRYDSSYSIVATAPANARQADIRIYVPPEGPGGVDTIGPFRVRAWNASGMSEPTTEVAPRYPPRRRSVSR